MQRRISGTVFMDAVDHEDFGSNETSNSTQPFTVVIDETMPANRVNLNPLKVGGEVRVECDLFVKSQGTGIVHVNGEGRLYEGDSEDTDDLEHTVQFNFSLPVGGIPVSYQFDLKNSGFGGGDSARIVLHVVNSMFEAT